MSLLALFRSTNPYDGLLKPRRRRRKKSHSIALFFLSILLLSSLAFAYFYPEQLQALFQRHHDSTPVDPFLSATVQAKKTVHDSVFSALIPSRVVVKDQPSLIPTLSDANIAEFVPGSPTVLRGTLKKDETLIAALVARGIDVNNTHAPVAATAALFNFRYSRPGDSWECEVSGDGSLISLRYQTSPEDVFLTTKDHDGSYLCEKLKIPIETTIVHLKGSVETNLWQGLEAAGASAAIASSFLEVFAYVIDFHSTTHPGDTFAIIYERLSLDGNFLRTGRMLAARYISSDQVFDTFYDITDASEEGDYYDTNGEGMQGSFLKSPLASPRITSTFGKRFHPILGKMKQHNGVDYGAPTGTPVQVVSDGLVTFAARKGANGNLVTVKHPNGYVTHYAHLSRILVKKGQEVRKKHVIGQVGSTGRSTGPHLHFGLSKDGRFLNPLKVQFPRISSLKGDDLKRFLTKVVEPNTAILDQLLPVPHNSSDASTITVAER